MNKYCPDDKILNPESGRCVSKTGAIGKKLLKILIQTKKIKEIKECPDDKILNPESGRCVNKTGAIGKKLLKVSKPISIAITAPIIAPIAVPNENLAATKIQAAIKRKIKDPIDIITNNIDDNVCNDVITIPQFSNTCWFTTFLMCMFYSQHSRELLLNKPFNTNTTVKKILNNILIDHYIENNIYINFFKKLNLHDLLEHFISDKKIINNIIKRGFNAAIFSTYFMKVIDKSSIILTKFNDTPNELYGGFITNYYIPNIYKKENIKYNETTIFNELNTSPDYIFITIIEKNFYKNNNVIDIFNLKNYSNIKYNGINELKETIEYNRNTYILDSCILNNFNSKNKIPSHSIAGIKCKNNKFVYNGWIKSTKDPAMLQNGIQHIPCKLMKYNWDITKNNEFCLNPILCKLGNALPNNLCFSFNKGLRMLIYVKK